MHADVTQSLQRRFDERQRAQDAAARTALKKADTSSRIDKTDRVIASEEKAISRIDEKVLFIMHYTVHVLHVRV